MNQQQFDRFKAMVRKGDVLFVSNEGFINDVIVHGQGILDKTWTNQLGHVGFVDSDGNIQESAIAEYQGKMCSGVLIRPLNAWFDAKATTKWLIIMRIDGITDNQIAQATAKGKYLQSKKLFYPIRELAGTLIASMNYKFLGAFKWMNKAYIEKCQRELLDKHNPINANNGMYCIAFANHCYESAGLRLIPEGINESICKVGDGLRNKALSYTVQFVVPQQYKDYHKASGQDFNLDIKS